MTDFSIALPIKILGEPFIAECDVNIISDGRPARMPDFNSPGDPAEPLEFDVDVQKLWRDKEYKQINQPPSLEIPNWLADEIDEFILNDSDCYNRIEEEWRS